MIVGDPPSGLGPAETGRRFLIIDDDSGLCQLMVEFFSQHGFCAEVATTAGEGLSIFANHSFDLVVLDVMLPILDGFEILRQIRKHSNIPVVMLTARTAQADRINGLNAGADDYLPKPFAPEELLARIRAVLRRSAQKSSVEDRVVESSGVSLHSRSREVWRGNEHINLTTIEFDILESLMRSAGRIVSRDALAIALYQRQSTPYERTLDVHVSHLRRKLGSDGPRLIETVRGSGYIFVSREERTK
jgi:two-component system response regulator CpxR